MIVSVHHQQTDVTLTKILILVILMMHIVLIYFDGEDWRCYKEYTDDGKVKTRLKEIRFRLCALELLSSRPLCDNQGSDHHHHHHHHRHRDQHLRDHHHHYHHFH